MDEKPLVTVIPPAPTFMTRVAIYCRVSTSSRTEFQE